MKINVLIFIILIIFSQCRVSTVSPINDERVSPIRELTLLEKNLVQSNNKFAFKIFNKISSADKNKNIFISPTSISMALGMVYNGANGTTQDAIRSPLELSGLSLPEENESYKSLIDLVGKIDPKVIFQIANSIWYKLGYTFEDVFLSDCKKYFNAEISGLDFSKPDASDIINSWVNKNTNGKITEIVDKPIDPSTVMFLINAIYFKGSWKYRFEETNTKDDRFYLSDGSNKNCKIMNQSARYQYYENIDFQAIQLPYGQGGYSMIVFMPRSGNRIDDFLGQFTRDNWNNWLSEFNEDSVNLFLPKFKLNYELGLNDVLTSLGMGIAFSKVDADFTGMYKPGGLYISGVKHKTFVEVNEEGTEAAAVTSIMMGATSIGEHPKVNIMYINHPFVFVIRENNSQTILFMGVIVDPGI